MNEDIIVLVDDREDKKFIAVGREIFPNLQVKRLLVGDIVIPEVNLAIEHKGGVDYPASFRDGRLYKQAKAMSDSFANSFVFFVGNWQKLQRKKHYEWFQKEQWHGSKATLNCEYQVPLVECTSNKDFWFQVQAHIKKCDPNREPHEPHIDLPKPDTSIELRWMLCINRLGRKRAKLFLEQYSFWDLPNISEKELMEIEGIGPGLARRIKSHCGGDNGF